MIQDVEALFRPVALPTEGVDRNVIIGDLRRKRVTVALPTEGVDRNSQAVVDESIRRVALPTEGVDRNFVISSW